MDWDSECSFLSAIPLFLGHKINLEFGCSGWEPEYSILGKEQFFLLKALDFEQRVPNFGTEARASYIFLSSLSSFSTHIIRTPSLPFGGRSSNFRITVGSVPRTAAFVGAASGIGKATLTYLVALKAQIQSPCRRVKYCKAAYFPQSTPKVKQQGRCRLSRGRGIADGRGEENVQQNQG
jgi:hypothetical protein